jgi:preprotein translocase subunit SecE
MYSMATTNPLQFIQQVRAEVARLATTREVMLTTVSEVLILAALDGRSLCAR